MCQTCTGHGGLPRSDKAGADDGDVALMIAHDPVGLGRELRLVDHDEPDTLLRQDLRLSLVVEPPLLATRHTGDGRATVEQRDGHGVLLLLELDDEPQRRPIPVDGEPASPSGRRRHVTDKPQERRLSLPADPDHLVAEVENIVDFVNLIWPRGDVLKWPRRGVGSMWGAVCCQAQQEVGSSLRKRFAVRRMPSAMVRYGAHVSASWVTVNPALMA